MEQRGHIYHDDLLRAEDFVIYGPTADITVDLLAWLSGEERNRVEQRTADLQHFAGAR